MRKRNIVLLVLIMVITIGMLSFKKESDSTAYISTYYKQLNNFKNAQNKLLQCIQASDLSTVNDLDKIRKNIQAARNELKGLDFWFRYLEPIAYKKINGPLPVEWETEVFEKFEKPYKREGAGLTLAALYLEEENITKDSLAQLIKSSIAATETFSADSITSEFKSYHSFYLCNRLYLLNLAAIYTTGFECPDTNQVIPELRLMMQSVEGIYSSFNESFPSTGLPGNYLQIYRNATAFVQSQCANFSAFDHFTFIKDYINPLFLLNQKLINQYHVVSKSLVDYSLNKKEITIFNKALYNGQNSKGIFLRVTDEKALAEIDRLGKLLFYDPILSGNNSRSCASCHKPTEYFTDTINTTASQFNRQNLLPRNAPSLVNTQYNHLRCWMGNTYLFKTKQRMLSPTH